MHQDVIREARFEDVPVIVTMGRHFVENGTGLSEHFTFDAHDAAETALELIEDDRTIFLVLERDGSLVGMIAVRLASMLFNRSAIRAYEGFWWVEPKHRGLGGIKLLREAERRAKELGAQSLIMVEPPWYDGLGRLYERRGYVLEERNYVKALS